ncbi:MAG: hypothetical protein V7607_1205 [Solirubrobacteraceae bacterium]
MSTTATTPRGTSATTRNRGMECPVCLAKIRGARSTLAACRPTCGACNVAFVWTSAEDAYALGESCAARDVEEAAYDRRLARESSIHSLGLKRTTVGQCGGCRKPILATNEQCGCGFANDLRGRRNLGGYAANGCPF